MKKIVSILLLVIISCSIIFSFSEDDNIVLSYDKDEITLPSGVLVDLGLTVTNNGEPIDIKISLPKSATDENGLLVVGDHTIIVKVHPHKRWVNQKEIILHVVDRSLQPEVTINENDYQFK